MITPPTPITASFPSSIHLVRAVIASSAPFDSQSYALSMSSYHTPLWVTAKKAAMPSRGLTISLVSDTDEGAGGGSYF